MCVYCNCGDWAFKHNPPWRPQDYPNYPATIPQPIVTPTPDPWKVQQLKEYLDLLKQIKEMEDKLGCPCEPNKADYVSLFEERIKHLEKKDAV